MSEKAMVSKDVRPDDIIFNCPQCTKSLAIDPRAAGFTVTCPDCGTEVHVPESDFGLAENLDETVAALRARLAAFENRYVLDRQNIEKIAQEMALIQASVDRTVALLQDILSPLQIEPPSKPFVQ